VTVPKPDIERRIGIGRRGESNLDSACRRGSNAQAEYLELAEMCLLEAERTLDSETAERLLTMARHYLDEAKRIRERS
jgi:hypothetical protein